MAVFVKSESQSLAPLIKYGFSAKFFSQHGWPLSESALTVLPEGSVRDASSGLYLKPVDPVVFSADKYTMKVVVLPDGKVALNHGGKYVSARRDRSLKMVESCRGWEAFRFDEVWLLGQPERAVDPRIGALNVLMHVGSMFRLRCAHGGLLTADKRCDGDDGDHGVVLFKAPRRLDVDRYELQATRPEQPAFCAGQKLVAHLRVGAGGVAKIAVQVDDRNGVTGKFLRADPSGALGERSGVAEEWENFLVEITEQSMKAGFEERARKGAKQGGSVGVATGGGRSRSTRAPAAAAGTGPSGLTANGKTAQDFDYASALRGAAPVAAGAAAASKSAEKGATKGADKGTAKNADKGAAKSADKGSTKEVANEAKEASASGAAASSSRRSKKKQRNGKKSKAPKSAPAEPRAPASPAAASGGASSSKAGSSKPAKNDVVVDYGSDDAAAAAPAPPRDPCFACGRALEGSIVTAMGRRYHAGCFKCGICRRPLTGGTFREDKGRALCDMCYKQKVAPPCALCGEGVVGTVTTALAKQWHPECFRCRRCNAAITADRFYVVPHKPNEPFCGSCGSTDRRMDTPRFTLARVGPFS